MIHAEEILFLKLFFFQVLLTSDTGDLENVRVQMSGEETRDQVDFVAVRGRDKHVGIFDAGRLRVSGLVPEPSRA